LQKCVTFIAQFVSIIKQFKKAFGGMIKKQHLNLNTMSTILIPAAKPLNGCTISYHPDPPQKVLNPSDLVATCPIPPIQPSVFKQSDGLLTGSFSVRLNYPGKLTIKAGYFSTAPGIVYMEISYNGVVSSGNVYETTVDVMIPTMEDVIYNKIMIYLNNRNGDGLCALPPFPFGDILNAGPPSSGTTSTGTSTTVQKGDEDTGY
jgi:hypothetical protein